MDSYRGDNRSPTELRRDKVGNELKGTAICSAGFQPWPDYKKRSYDDAVKEIRGQIATLTAYLFELRQRTPGGLFPPPWSPRYI
jgi:hypothetical protein